MSSTHYLLAAGQRACFTFKSYPARIRNYTSQSAPNPPPPPPASTSSTAKSRHVSFYSDTLPAMIPVFLLGSAVFLALQLTQLKLSHAKFMEEATDHIAQLESEIQALQQKRAAELTPAPANPSSSSTQTSSRWRWW